MFTISVLKDSHVIPVVLALLKNKAQVTYMTLYRVLIKLEGGFNPLTIKTDLELGSINALVH